ncbi:hypothetical protein ACFYNO_26245 [Kitasatospora sp. NPDC006697]|uniref:hypothetical protein n=1 Tax=Kitasatospora sp. NPDC006697 TaxID=3364020 RepID=UPI0036BDA850
MPRHPRPVSHGGADGLLALGLSLALGLAATGCAAGPGNRPRPPAAAATTAATTAAPAVAVPASSLHLPIEAYLLSTADSTRLQTARAALIGSCMKRFGADYTPAVTAGPRSQMANRYGPTDPDTARTYGYHAPDAQRPANGQPSAPALPPDLAAVLGHGAGAPQLPGAPPAPATYHGLAVPPGGCVGEADRALTAGGGILQDDQAAVDINFQDYQRSLADAGVTAAFARWSSCMAAQGYRYDNPQSAVNDTRWRTPAPSAQEIATAAADVACKQQAGVVAAWFGAESQLEEQDIRTRSADLTRVRQSIDTALRNAGSAG